MHALLVHSDESTKTEWDFELLEARAACLIEDETINLQFYL